MSNALERFFKERELDFMEKEEKEISENTSYTSFIEDVSYLKQKYGKYESAY